LLAILGEVGKLDAALAAANRRRQRDRQDIEKIVPRRIGGAWIGNIPKDRNQPARRFFSIRNRIQNPSRSRWLPHSSKCDSPGRETGKRPASRPNPAEKKCGRTESD
jgi:hypothetical protein